MFKKNPKNMSYKQLKKSGLKINPNSDTDKDGFKNSKDCRPLDKKRHSIATTFAIGASASFVGSEISKYVTKRRKIAKLKQKQDEQKYWK